MAVYIRACAGPSRNFHTILRYPGHISRASTAICLAQKESSHSRTQQGPSLYLHNRQYSSFPNKTAYEWIKNKFLTALALAGVTGGALLFVSLIVIL